MRHSEKLPGKTLAESLGIEVDPKAPGGQTLGYVAGEGGQRSTRQHHVAASIEYDGFSDVDGYR